MIKKIKYIAKIILGKEIVVFNDINLKTKWYGNLYAGFFVYTKNLNQESIVYSFGIGEDISFDEELIKEFDCTIYGFDPTPKSIEYIKGKKDIHANYHLEPYGLYNYDGEVNFLLPENSNHVSCTIETNQNIQSANKLKVAVPVLTFNSIIQKLGHKKIDILKIDIEGTEYDVLENIFDSEIEIRQICIEFHHRFPNISKEKTKNAIKLIRSKGFKLVAISEQREEFTFLNCNQL